MYNAKLNILNIGGVVTGVDIKQNQQNGEYFGTYNVVADLGSHDGTKWNEKPSYYVVTVNNTMCQKFKNGLNVGDYIELDATYITEGDKGQYTKLRMIALNNHTPKTLVDFIWSNNMGHLLRKPNYVHATFGGNISSVDIKKSDKLDDDGNDQFFGSISIALDNGWMVKGEGYKEQTAFLHCNLNNNVIKRIKSGYKKGDQIVVSGELFQDKWLDKGTNKNNS